MIKESALFSIIFQLLILIISVYFSFYKIDKKSNILKETLILENIVQTIELAFYIIVIYLFYNKFDKIDVAKYRYYDWIITTPIMILTTIIYFEYNNFKHTEKILSIVNFVKNNITNIVKLFVLNFFMLLFGFLKELNIISLFKSTFFGFLFFILLFYYIWKDYAINSSSNNFIFFTMLIIWSLYGIAAIFNNKIKNTSYNILDIVSKNFYALYLSYIIYNKKF